ncbi:TorF family putative porin [Shewanella acanthi]|uniref:TorF family putative porin n=1 Tax=Shewanella acanthi TaxID=2864212 RepID=UPI001C6562D4|nr:TorF family putative porin [Shewanella acanthi]QYJ78057.1 TorF family putative porin [Shewanella acanthi]
MYNNLNKKRLVPLVALALSATLFTDIAAAEVSGEIAVTNDYRFRGISQTAGDPAVQAGVDWSFESGFSVGAWASNVDFDEPGYNGPDIEYDFYVAYGGEINEDISYDVTLNRYNYSGDSDLGYFEVTAGVEYSGFRLAYWFTDDYSGTDLDYHYTELNYSYEFVENWSVDFHYGYNAGDALDDGEGFDSYSDYSIGVSTELAGFGLSLAWLGSDLDGAQKVSKGAGRNDDTILATVSYAF